jgi:hypothetical protein
MPDAILQDDPNKLSRALLRQVERTFRCMEVEKKLRREDQRCLSPTSKSSEEERRASTSEGKCGERPSLYLLGLLEGAHGLRVPVESWGTLIGGLKAQAPHQPRLQIEAKQLDQ